jgi:hypothetical protein
MQANFTLKLNQMLRSTIICCAMVGTVALALASSGGGGKKNQSNIPLKPEFTPIRTTNGFTLKAGPLYSGSHLSRSQQASSYITYNSLVTYEQGNKIFILPSSVKIKSQPTFRSNLNVLDLKVRLRK